MIGLAFVVVLVLPVCAAASEEQGWGILLTVGRLFNLALVVWILARLLKKPLASFFESRTQSIREQFAEAEQARREAESKLAEIESRMSRLDLELAEMRQSAEKEAQEERQRVLLEADRDAERIIHRARQEIDGLTKIAQQDLRTHAAQLSVRLAEEQIRSDIKDEDRQNLFAGFLQGLGGKK